MAHDRRLLYPFTEKWRGFLVSFLTEHHGAIQVPARQRKTA